MSKCEGHFPVTLSLYNLNITRMMLHENPVQAREAKIKI